MSLIDWSQRPYALVTGASEGIGEELALALARRGTHSLILVARTRSKLERVERRIREACVSLGHTEVDVKIICEDLSATGAAEKVFQATKGLPVAILANNAGMAIGGPTDNLELAKVEQILQLNIVTLTLLVQLYTQTLVDAAAYYRARQHLYGKHRMAGIVNMSSLSALMPIPHMSLYAASKAYVLSLTEALHHEHQMHNTGLAVVAILPGATVSPIWAKEGADPSKVLLPFTTMDDVVRATLKALDSNKAVIVPGYLNNVLSFSVRLAPRWLVRRLAYIFMRQG
ncbi:NAD(P)-binding protein [Acaromyces ingoldii]|uniref:NAD(P)-binding protein n=1 Tax=Acaromyces ingoldii TaxID=215250 RepID=A0A316YV44_9BASI|nr:NAD(P)-binding protein [Acaromyces ingoldii]PWN92926.1 NAD(P)-binding protein [Acaromyces ingoldii]